MLTLIAVMAGVAVWTGCLAFAGVYLQVRQESRNS